MPVFRSRISQFIRSVHTTPFYSENIRKAFVIHIFSLVAVVSMLYFLAEALWVNQFLHATFLSVFLILFVLLIFFSVLKPQKYRVASNVIVLLGFCFAVYLFINGSRQYAGLLWHFLFGTLAFVLVGKQKAMLFALSLMLSSILIYYGFPDIPVQYPEMLIWRYVFVFSLVSVLLYVYEYARERTEETLKEKREELSDILTQLMQQNEEIRVQTEMVAEANRELEKYSLVARETNNAVSIYNPNGQLEWANKSFEENFGLYLSRMSLTERSIFNFSTNEQIRELWLQCLEQKSSVVYRCHWQSDGGPRLYLQSNLSPVVGLNGEVERLILVESNITELKRVEDELKRLNQELEKRVVEELEKNRQKDLLMIQQNRQAALGEMISNIAHQWRQPLNAIAVTVENMAEAWEFGELTTSYMQEKVRKTMGLLSYMSNTIDDFRNFFKPEREKTRFNINSMVIKAVSFVEASFRDQNIFIEKEMSDELYVYGYPNEYMQVVINILNNARDALVENKIAEPVIRVRLYEQGNQQWVRIFNNGLQIAPEIGLRIFDPYFTTRHSSGTGLGLYMAKNIIEKNMEGKIGFENKESGVEFFICINKAV